MASSKEQILQSAEKFLAKGKLEPALKEYLRLLDENSNMRKIEFLVNLQF